MPPAFFKYVLASAAKSAVFEKPESSFGARVQPALGVCSKSWSALFACPSFEKEDVVYSYYGSLAYADLEKKSQMKKRYGKRYMEVPVRLSCR